MHLRVSTRETRWHSIMSPSFLRSKIIRETPFWSSIKLSLKLAHRNPTSLPAQKERILFFFGFLLAPTGPMFEGSFWKFPKNAKMTFVASAVLNTDMSETMLEELSNVLIEGDRMFFFKLISLFTSVFFRWKGWSFWPPAPREGGWEPPRAWVKRKRPNHTSPPAKPRRLAIYRTIHIQPFLIPCCCTSALHTTAHQNG